MICHCTLNFTLSVLYIDDTIPLNQRQKPLPQVGYGGGWVYGNVVIKGDVIYNVFEPT